jgi:hypothetical protein
MKNKSEIQSILFDKRKWSKADAIRWLKAHKYKYNKVDPGKGFYRFRQTTPNYPRYGELKWEGGINAVVGFRGAKPKGKKRNPKTDLKRLNNLKYNAEYYREKASEEWKKLNREGKSSSDKLKQLDRNLRKYTDAYNDLFAKMRNVNPRLSANEKRLRVSRGMQKAKESRLKFSWQDDVKTYNMNVQMPKAGDAVMMIGTAENLDYVSDKFDGNKRLYTHKLKKHGIVLAVMPKSGDVVKTVIITDLALHIRPEGLTG